MKRMFSAAALAVAALAALRAAAAPPSEISVDLKLDETAYVSGERIRGVVDVKNMSPDFIGVGRPGYRDRLFVEVFRASDYSQLEKAAEVPFVAPFSLESNEGQRLETFLADHYGLSEPRRYSARPVLVHRGQRYEGSYRQFDVVPGIRVARAVQMFSNRDGLGREFELLRWSRQGREHLFLAAHDYGTSERRWRTTDVGPAMRITNPTVSIMPNGEVIVFHRNGPDSLVRSEFWSLPDDLEFRSRTMVLDPETAGQNRVRELYEAGGGVKPVDRPWWKFW